MKRIICGVAVALLVMAMSTAARAEEGVEVEAGLKVWMNKWKQTDPAGTKTAENMFLAGPAIEVKFHNNVFVEAATMISTSDYKLTDDTGVTVELSRNDIDLAAGYMFGHNVGAFVGYRNSTVKEKETGINAKSYGPLVGIRGSIPVHEAVSLYGKATYLLNKFKETDIAAENAPGWIAELGVKYEFSKNISGDLGYKYETTKTKDTNIKDTFTGFTLGAMYAF